jgi:hypothetical protein
MVVRLFLWVRLFLRMKSPSQMPTVSSSGPLHNAALLHPYHNAAPISSKNVLLILPYLVTYPRSGIVVYRYFFRTNAFFSHSTTVDATPSSSRFPVSTMSTLFASATKPPPCYTFVKALLFSNTKLNCGMNRHHRVGVGVGEPGGGMAQFFSRSTLA